MLLLGVVEHDRGALADASLEMLTMARGVASEHGGALEAVAMGQAGEALAERLASFGVERLHVVTDALVDDYAPEAFGEALAQLVATCEPTAVLASGSERGNEVMAHLAARTGLPLAAGCTTLRPDGADRWQLVRQRWGGVLLEEAVLTAPAALATVAPHAVAAVEADEPAEIAVKAFAPELDPVLARTRVIDRAERRDGVTLATAPVVVSGGRGVGSADGFAVLEELAELVGGAVGCSRVATNNGWRPHSDQVGQTGTRVAPDLYIACGISGATQHWVGCKDAKRILAVNTDPEAPMVTRADYAVIGDVTEVLDAVVEEVRQRRGVVAGAG